MRTASRAVVASVGFRIIALVILILGATATFFAQNPRPASYEQFASSLASGHIDEVRIERSHTAGKQVFGEWAVSPFHWRSGPVTAGAVDSDDDFERLMARNGVPTELYNSSDSYEWLPTSADTPFGWVVTVTWVVTILVMLLTTPRYGTKWAWFWLFVIGGIGPFLFLLIEPRPLWRRTPDQDPLAEPVTAVPERQRWTGIQGCLGSIAVSWAVIMAAAVLGWAWRSVFS